MSENNGESKDLTLKKTSEKVLSSEKREDVWAIIIAVTVMIISIAAPDFIHDLFKHGLFIF